MHCLHELRKVWAVHGGEHGAGELRARVGERVPWWAVLAVALALMALVASLTSGGPPSAPVTSRDAGRAVTARPSGGAAHAPSSDHAAGVPTTTSPLASPGPAGSSSAPGAPPSDAPPTTGPPATVPPAPDSPTTTTLPASALVVDPVTTTTSPPTTGARSEDEPGNLEYPGNVSATYTVAASGTLTATATWTGTPDLSVSLTCPGGQSQKTGGPGLSASVPSGSETAAVTCTVVLAETPTADATVSYSLQITHGGS